MQPMADIDHVEDFLADLPLSSCRHAGVVEERVRAQLTDCWSRVVQAEHKADEAERRAKSWCAFACCSMPRCALQLNNVSPGCFTKIDPLPVSSYRLLCCVLCSAFAKIQPSPWVSMLLCNADFITVVPSSPTSHALTAWLTCHTAERFAVCWQPKSCNSWWWQQSNTSRCFNASHTLRYTCLLSS